VNGVLFYHTLVEKSIFRLICSMAGLFFLFGEYTNETITGSQNYFEIEFTRRVP
jgi:hypothetical protein